ncbi:hypothetical protein C1Y40_04593 [Mycobacterium talmoniae]|uniref:Uncharacterized protein n=1 Tax=Mycobacterium talmoniae TaxID=1858794 RepID=A0A2S8BF60_9MYCO|nr:hypothetical protein [Mycobacterium eburneum]PQM45269.1 hypothetical protein C1Y40_04593 [Mycobacterium talmoniae]TDH47219.1 hypothetical protein E2F47_26685 [Mycobacterium eburneum]
MSAFVVHPEHLHVLLWTSQQHSHRGPLRWCFGNPSDVVELQPENVDEVGQMLLDANIDSVDYLYNETGRRDTYHYRRPQHTGWSIPELLNVLHCYVHQACERPQWSTSQAKAFCDALQQRLISQLPGYSDGPWGIDDSSKPAALRRLA